MLRRALAALGAFLFGSAIALTGAVAAPVVILSSTVDDYTPGMVLDGATEIAVPAGGLVMFNDATGATRTLNGPYSGAISQAEGGAKDDNTLVASLSRLVVSREDEQAKLGAIRALPGNLAREIYVLDVARSATQCAAMGQPIRFWRPETLRGDALFSISAEDGGAPVVLTWRAADETLDWPDSVPVTDGAAYQVKLDFTPRPAQITLRLVPSAIEEPAAIAAWMADAGCRRQALQLVASLGG